MAPQSAAAEAGVPFAPAEPTSEAHAEAPLNVGQWTSLCDGLDPARVHSGLLSELQGATDLVQEVIWEILVGNVEPLQLLRDTLAMWQERPGADQDSGIVEALAGDVTTLLDPELWCDDFRLGAKRHG